MIRTLTLKSNLCRAIPYLQTAGEVYFCPDVKSLCQKNFLERRFFELKKIIPSLIWSCPMEKGLIASWDSEDEIRCFGKDSILPQNRFFAELPFKCPENFTSFRKLAELHLPRYFEETITPWDDEVLNELTYYFDNKKLASNYFEERNGLIGRDYSTKLSAFLACGALDVRYLFNRVKDFEDTVCANKSTYWIIFELLWREFFYWHYKKHQRRYFSKNGLKGKLNFTSFQTYQFDELRKISHHPFFTAALNELNCTGYMSNRARQIFASQWINDLQLDWRSGAKLFENNLIDYDVYSNYGNWMYLAGVGTDPRGKRYFNVDKQLERYDSRNLYIKKWQSKSYPNTFTKGELF